MTSPERARAKYAALYAVYLRGLASCRESRVTPCAYESLYGYLFEAAALQLDNASAPAAPAWRNRQIAAWQATADAELLKGVAW